MNPISFTGSAATIKSEKITSRQTSNVTNALSGQVAGVQTTSSSGQPGKDAEVRIRGIGSISASNKPLYVVDGVPYDGEISAISTSDIESMTVLKDAASNALYGARGANGVILITTKKGKSGEARVSLDAKWGVNKRCRNSFETFLCHHYRSEYGREKYLSAYHRTVNVSIVTICSLIFYVRSIDSNTSFFFFRSVVDRIERTQF